MPCGIAARQRSPCGARPSRRAILVETLISSMKVSLAGSRPSWLPDQSSRRFRTSGRSCSLTSAVFCASACDACRSAKAQRRSAAPAAPSAPAG